MDIVKTLGLNTSQPGRDGTSAYSMDLSNEMDGVAVNSSGRVMEDTTLRTVIKLYYGEYDLSITSEPVVVGLQEEIECTIDYTEYATSVPITFFIPEGTILKNQSAVITAENQGKGPLTRDFNIRVFPAGADGQPGTVFFLEPSVDVIKVDKEGTYSTDKIVCRQFKRIGDGEKIPTDYVIKYSQDNEEEIVYEKDTELPVGDINQSIRFSLYRNGELIDSETVLVIRDGKDAGIDDKKPDAPLITAIAYKDYIFLNASIDKSGSNNNVKKVVWFISSENFEEGKTLEIETSSTSFDYYFERNDILGYPEKNNSGNLIDSENREWKIKARVHNFNTVNIVSDFSTEKSITTDRTYTTWIPKAPENVSAVPNKNGISIKWDYNKTLGEDRFSLVIKRGEEGLETSISGLSSDSYEYRFDRNREIDGYPEWEDLEDYSVTICHYNDIYEDGESTETELTDENYGTWLIGNIKNSVSFDVMDRTVMLKMTIPNTSREYYGSTKYKVSIKRAKNTLPGIGEEIPEEVIEEDTQWYKPNLYGEFLDNTEAYKDTESTEDYLESDSRFTQTLPLLGQKAIKVEGEDKELYRIINTVYKYRIIAFNESGVESTGDNEFTVTALCTSLRDVVKADEETKRLTVGKLSALSADVGLLSQGGFGDFKGWTNFWALSKMFKEDTGLDRDLPEGAFRVGDDNQYIAVVPPKCIFGEEGKSSYIDNSKGEDTIIKIKAGNIEMVTRGSSFNGGTYIYDENNGSNRMKLNSNGLQIEALEETVDEQGETVSKWVAMGDITLDQKGNLMITNTGDSNENKPKYGIYTSSTAQIYRFENNLKSESGTNELEGIGTFIDSPFSDNEFGNAFSGELKIPTNREACCLNNNGLVVINNRNILDIENDVIRFDSTLTDWETKLGLSTGIFKWEE